jgi:hypothetical protein
MGLRLLFLFEGIAGAPILDESVGMVGAGTPIAVRTDKFFFGDEELAVTALEVFVLNLVIASFPECCKLVLHASP